MKVLLVDTGFSALPIFRHLVERGHDVWVMGNRARDAIAREAGERWIEQDYSDVSAVAAHAERLGIDRLVPGCTDVSIATCVAIAGGDGRLDRADANHVLADKASFRALCADLDLPAPRAIDPAKLPATGRFICKPVDAFSGRGISVFDAADRQASRDAIDRATAASPTGRLLIEPFVTGQLHSWSVFIEDRRAVEGTFVIEGSSVDPYAVDTSHVVFDMPEAARAQLATAVDRIAEALGLVDGLVHLQFLWDGERVSIVEITRRCPGDLYALLIEYSTGYRHAAKYASHFLGESLAAAATERRPVLRHTVTSPEARIYSGLGFDHLLPVRAFFALQGLGEPLAPGHAGRIGVLFVEPTDEASRDEAYRLFLERRVYRPL